MENQEIEKRIIELEKITKDFQTESKDFQFRLGEAEVRIKDLLGMIDKLKSKVTTEVSSATPTINTDRTTLHSITALAAAITSFTTNLSGNPKNGDILKIRILDDGNNRAIAWGTSFSSKGGTLPATTTAGKLLTIILIYNSVTLDWECIITSEEA